MTVAGSRSPLLDARAIKRALDHMAKDIIDLASDTNRLVLVEIQRPGVEFAERLALLADELLGVRAAAEQFKEVSERAIKQVRTLVAKPIDNLFYEDSTRPRISFAFAEKRLSADTVNDTPSGSSIEKGENLVDTPR